MRRLPPPLCRRTWPLPLLSPLAGNMAPDMAVFSVSQLHVEWLAKLLPQDRVYLGKVSVGGVVLVWRRPIGKIKCGVQPLPLCPP